MGEGRGGEPPAATPEQSVGRPTGRGVNKQRAGTLNLPPYQHCMWPIKICRTAIMPETDTSIKLYILPTCESHSGCSLLAADDSRLPPGLSTWERPVCFVIWLRRSFPCCCTSQGLLPNHSCAAWCLLCCSIHVFSASSTPECCVKFHRTWQTDNSSDRACRSITPCNV